MKKKKVYISGQITGLEKETYTALFSYAEKKIESAGYTAINPARLDDCENPEKMEWSDFLRRDIKLLCGCDYICLLPNWKESRGARLEATIAEQLGIQSVNLTDF